MSNKLTFTKLLENLLLIQSSPDNNIKMSHYLCKILRTHKIPYRIDNTGNIIARKGTLAPGEYYPTIVAHYDTVHDLVTDYTVQKTRTTHNKTRYSSPTGVGGDDKVGLALALWIAITKPKIKLVFTVGEESGCIGANALTPEDFTDSGYLIEPDRRGNTDLITSYMGSTTANADFHSIAKEAAFTHGYREESGLVTDVFELQSNGVDLSAINLSVGYYEPHSNKEYVILEDAIRSLHIIRTIINKAGYNRFDHHRSEALISRYNRTLSHHALGYSHWPRFAWDDDDLIEEESLFTGADAVALSKINAPSYDDWLDEVIYQTGVADTDYLEKLGAREAFQRGISTEDFIDSVIPKIMYNMDD